MPWRKEKEKDVNNKAYEGEYKQTNYNIPVNKREKNSMAKDWFWNKNKKIQNELYYPVRAW